MELNFCKIVAFLVCMTVTGPVRAEESMTAKAFEAIALESNLDLRLEGVSLKRAKAEAAGLRVPPPQVGVSQMNMQGGDTAQGWQVSQAIPFPTKVNADYKARQHALEAEKSSLDAKVQEIKAMARYIYFFVWESQEQERVLKEKLNLLKRHMAVAKSLARSDTFAKVHLLKVESDLDQVMNDLEAVSLVQKERMTTAAEFLDKDPSNFKFEAQDPGLSKAPAINSVEHTPQIKSAKKQVKRFEALERAGQAEWLPDFNLTYSHMEETPMFPENNQIMLGVSLPFIYFWQSKSASNQASAEKLSAEIEYLKIKRSIQAEKANLDKAVDSLKKQITTLTNNILPRSIRRKQMFQNIAPRDLSSLQEHLDTFISVPDIQLQILDLKSKYEWAVAGLAKYQSAEVKEYE